MLSPFPLESAAIICTNVQKPTAAFNARDCRIPPDKRFLILIYSDDAPAERIALLNASDPCAPFELFRGESISDAIGAILSAIGI